MIDLMKEYGKKYKVTMTEEYRHGGDLDNEHYMIILGKRGDVMAWDDELLEVTVIGVPLKIPAGVLPEKTHNLALPIKYERIGWKAKNHYDDSTCFLVPKDQYRKVFKVIKVRNRRQVTPELLARLATMRAGVKLPLVANEMSS